MYKISVSYTHLDVYKRQVHRSQAGNGMLYCGTSDFKAVTLSITTMVSCIDNHTYPAFFDIVKKDVYKRQDIRLLQPNLGF